jgi:hypothetical protein|tara:strand:+ start:355 stop:687 length:333 start_codon:yes stop_codon:yes gene_type:complete
MMDYEKDNMVPVDSPKAKGGKVDDGHKMVMHQLNHLHHNACELLKHLSGCSTPHLEEEWVKKKIILANDYLDSVHDYVMSSHDGKMEEDKEGKSGGFLMVVEKMMSKHKP